MEGMGMKKFHVALNSASRKKTDLSWNLVLTDHIDMANGLKIQILRFARKNNCLVLGQVQ